MSSEVVSKSDDTMGKIVSLCKRRGFIFQSSEIYGGLKSAYDFGPLGASLKRNIANAWWRSMVEERDNIYGLDASIMMHPKVWEASGHLSGFSDPLVDCRNCKERFRADKAPRVGAGLEIELREGGKKDGKKIKHVTTDRGYACPNCGSTDMSGERQFNLMFRTDFGPVDPLSTAIEQIAGNALSPAEIRTILAKAQSAGSVYLRPETAQAMFVQFLNVQQSMSAKVPFGIAQIGKSFRNEIITEHFIFRSVEFEQMEMEFFCEPGTQKEWMSYWTKARLDWYRKYANEPDAFKLRAHEQDELAHYSDECFDVEYLYPWGWDELEGIASRTDYDLKKHSEHSKTKLSYFDPLKPDPTTGQMGWRYTPYVIEPAAGLTRSVLCFLCDAYREEISKDGKGEEKTRVYLKLHPALAPIKAAVFPLVKKDGQPELAQKLKARLAEQGVYAAVDENQSIGKRYAKHDEIGTPYCITVDNESLTDQCATLRFRDTCEQERIPMEKIPGIIKERLQF